ncbi:MAG: GMC family oxidoreductase [Myxococcales bacterium]|nr:GMC family oxidoreductase [Myxococcales bacterium]
MIQVASLHDTPEGAPELSADVEVVIIGSGAAGAAAARRLARGGVRVLIVEEGPAVAPSQFVSDSFGAMAQLYRDAGAQVAFGPAFLPVLQGRCVGGSTVFNGAICWRLPRDVWQEWVAADPALEGGLPWEAIERALDEVERDLEVAPTDPAIAGRKNELMARGAAALGLEGRPTRRNVRGCEGLGRCLQGCPRGHKLGMDRTYLPEARTAGATLWAGCRVDAIAWRGTRALGVRGTTFSGGRFTVRASRAVVLAASAVQSPVLLQRSNIGDGPVGEGFQAHPGVSVAGRFDEPVRMWEGATQGYEVIGLRREGLKFEALGFGAEILAMRLPGAGAEFARAVGEMDRWADWGCAVRARARGTVRPSGRSGVKIRYALTDEDLGRVRRGVRVLGELLFAAGARAVACGVHGFAEQIDSPKALARFEEEGPRDPRAYPMAMTHLFGTCRMGSDPRTSVVRPDFRHHRIENLYVVDSSVFPTNIGVNPQNSILALATVAADGILRA